MPGCSDDPWSFFPSISLLFLLFILIIESVQGGTGPSWFLSRICSKVRTVKVEAEHEADVLYCHMFYQRYWWVNVFYHLIFSYCIRLLHYAFTEPINVIKINPIPMASLMASIHISALLMHYESHFIFHQRINMILFLQSFYPSHAATGIFQDGKVNIKDEYVLVYYDKLLKLLELSQCWEIMKNANTFFFLFFFSFFFFYSIKRFKLLFQCCAGIHILFDIVVYYYCGEEGLPSITDNQ